MYNYLNNNLMKKSVLITGLLFFAIGVLGQNEKLVRIYGGIPTANANMKWQNNLTPNEKYIGIIHVDSTASATQIIEAFMATFQPLEDANIMTKQMHNLSAAGEVLSSTQGDYKSMDEFSKAGDAAHRRQYKDQHTWTVQFIDGVRSVRFYYNIFVQAKDGRYKLTVTPAGSSGYAVDHIQTEWSRMFKNGEVRGMYSKYYNEIKIKLAYTIDQWINKVNKHLEAGSNDW